MKERHIYFEEDSQWILDELWEINMVLSKVKERLKHLASAMREEGWDTIKLERIIYCIEDNYLE